MPDKQIHEFNAATESVTGSNILHTQQSGNIDVRITVQDILDQISTTDIPADISGAVDTVADKIIIGDDSVSETRAIDWATFLATLNVLTISGSITPNGYADLGGLQFRWGTTTSNTNSSQAHAFAAPFSTNCFVCIGMSTEADGTKPIPVVSWDIAGFNTNRDFGSGSTSVTVGYIAIGN